MLDTLSYIGENLNKYKVTWAVGASMLLNQYGLVNSPNDIDILIELKDIEKADTILKGLGEKKKWEKVESYSTKYFYEYIINSVDVDVISGLAINHIEGTYEYHFDKNSISEYREINGVKIPFTSMEDWYVLYQLIPKRQAKVSMIKNHLLNNGVKKRFLLQRLSEGNLPLNVQNQIKEMLKI